MRKFFNLTLAKHAFFRGETYISGRNGPYFKAFFGPIRHPFVRQNVKNAAFCKAKVSRTHPLKLHTHSIPGIERTPRRGILLKKLDSLFEIFENTKTIGFLLVCSLTINVMISHVIHIFIMLHNFHSYDLFCVIIFPQRKGVGISIEPVMHSQCPFHQVKCVTSMINFTERIRNKHAGIL